jgi:acetyl-CoA carboxylase carboxyl transferase subunit beta
LTWFKRQSDKIQASEEKRVRTEGLWVKCEGCRQIIWKKELEDNLNVCTKCDYHFRMDAHARVTMLLDEDTIETFDDGLAAIDPLQFRDTRPYKDRLVEGEKKTSLKDALIAAKGELAGRSVILDVMEFGFIGGSMGAVVGEKITRSIERALEERKPLIVVSSSSGARMQEGVISLMQMAKISGSLAQLDEAKVPYISVLTDPTTGGVTASYAMLGDLNIAEPGALIGFAGPRVIEQTIRQKLPEGFQRSEFLLEHGMLDAVVHRKEMKNYIARALDFMTPKAA